MNDAHPARWWEPDSNGKLLCTLCPRYCTLGVNQHGFCFIRKNVDNKMVSLAYGKPLGFALDPIEKKPLNHFLPGSTILSFGTAGCNLGCKFCQNWTMSKAKIDISHAVHAAPEEVISLAKRQRAPSIAFTYNDPVIFGEYVIDVAQLAREENVRTVMVTAGYIDAKARKDVFQYIDAANVDLKAFTERFYHQLTVSHLRPVLDTLVWLKQETDVWIEITTLLIPDENDSSDEIKSLCGWILDNLGADVPVHFTAFHPSFKMRNKPSTPASTLLRAQKIARDAGLRFCYTGNIHCDEGQTTSCPRCGVTLIERGWHTVAYNALNGDKCPSCGSVIPGRFS